MNKIQALCAKINRDIRRKKKYGTSLKWVPRGPLARNRWKQRGYVTAKVGKRKFGYSVSGARRGPMSAQRGPVLQAATCSRIDMDNTSLQF